MKAVIALLPSAVDARIRAFSIASLVAQILIVGTGGAVRLTGSGLGCPTWPLCTNDSLINTPEMGIHGIVEFGNRLLSIAVGLIAVILVVLLLRIRSSRADIFVPTLLVLVGTIAQGVIGGISVRVRLDPFIVGSHFVISAVLVGLATVVVYRVFAGGRGIEPLAPPWLRRLTHVTSLLVAATVVVGVLTTGSGPHAGDSAADRNGLDPEVLQHVHSWPAYATFAATVVLVVASWRLGGSLPRFLKVLLAIEVVQIIVGITQSRLGLPEILVGVHMVLAVCLVAAMTAVVLSLRGSAKVDTAGGEHATERPTADAQLA